MHYTLEIILPADTKDIEASISNILAPFQEEIRDEDTGEWTSNSAGFLDYFVIGGRWSGRKREAELDKDKLQEFYDWLNAEKVTVSGVQFGKQELSPASQIEKVDRKWNEMFPHPSGQFQPCSLFKHSGESGESSDVCKLSELPSGLSASRVIIAGPSFEYDEKTDSGSRTGPLEAVFMVAREFWNGCNHQDTTWSGEVEDACNEFAKYCENRNEEYRDQMLPGEDALVVTVDYHS